MNLGEILDRSLQIYRKQFWAFLAVAFVPAVVVEGTALADAFGFHLYSSAVSDNHWTLGIYMTRAVFAIGYYHLESFVGFLVFPVILKLVSGIVLCEEIKTHQAWRFFGARWRIYLWLAALTLIAGLVIIEALTIALFVSTMETLDALGAKGFLESEPTTVIAGFWFAAGLLAFLWVGSSLSLAIPAAAIENLKAFRALGRSWKLTRRSRWRIALTWVALATASWMLSASFRGILRLIAIRIAHTTHVRWISHSLYPILSQTLNLVVLALFGPIYPIALTLFYYDQRIRLEGYDIERMMDAAGLTVPTMTAPTPILPAPPAEEETLVTPAATPAITSEAHL
jgi:hypothetical protein